MSLIVAVLIGFISIIVPGFFLALALLKKTGMSLFEIAVIGFIFGMIFPPTMIWLESYMMNSIHFFTFSAGLYNINVILLTIIGIALCVWQGAIDVKGMNLYPSALKGGTTSVAETQDSDYKNRVASLRKKMSDLNMDFKIIKDHEREEQQLIKNHMEEMLHIKNAGQEERNDIELKHKAEEKKLFEKHESDENLLMQGGKKEEAKDSYMPFVWIALLALMILTFATRIISIGIAPTFFEFDPYYDMQATEYILTYGYQPLYDHSAWPTLTEGTIHRVQPLIPYIEAYWYDIAGPQANLSSPDTTLLSNVSSYYPAISAALLVFVVFIFIYYEYGRIPALIGAGLAAAMPALITTFIAGEQLLEPWGIFAMFFFYMSYLLAVRNPKETRFAILAGIAFASTFLGAHYYTVTAGVMGIYIVFQGFLDIMRGKDMRDFYMMNAKVLAVVIIFYILYAPYGATLTNAIPNVLGIPIIIALPLLALVLVAIFDYIPKLMKQYKMIPEVNTPVNVVWLVVLIVFALLLILLTPLGTPIKAYLALSTHYITGSIPLFLTVQEYAPTGFNYNFGPAGFGIIGESIGGVAIIVWGVLILFSILEVLAVFKRDSKTSILALSAVWPLAIAGMIEIKYLPHFGVGYIIAICAIVGELALILKGMDSKMGVLALYVGAGLIVVAEATVFIFIFAGLGKSCVTITNNGNSIAYDLYCNTVPTYWLQATTWMRTNVGPLGPRILSWWDYGDWINWFGNSNAVLRGDNAVATLDYATAARFVFGAQDSYRDSFFKENVTFNAPQLSDFMDSVQAKYVLFDNQLMQKWGALDFLACIDVNQTSLLFAESQGTPYALGTSQCEINHDPAFIYIPAGVFTTAVQNNVNDYCQLPNSSITAAKALIVTGETVLNQTYCVPLTSNSTVIKLLNMNGTATNILLVLSPDNQFYYGPVLIPNEGEYLDFMAVYIPNGPNDTITDAPSQFYDSNYYRGFMFGKMPGFTLVYPSNFTGINYVNTTAPIMIYETDNFTGQLPPHTPKPSWVSNNYTIPV